MKLKRGAWKMNINFRSYRSEDLLKVRHFLIQSYSKLKTPNLAYRPLGICYFFSGDEKWNAGAVGTKSGLMGV